MPELSIRKIIEKTLSGEIRIPSFQRISYRLTIVLENEHTIRKRKAIR